MLHVNRFRLPLSLGLSAIILLSENIARANTPESFSFQGVLTDANGSPSSEQVKLRLQILAPNGCLLYEEETPTIDLSATQGRFSVSVGSPVVSSRRTSNDAGLAMKAVFNNSAGGARASNASTCPSGYAPAVGDKRKLHVIVIGQTTDALSPDLTLETVPFAMTAQTLQGKEPGDFVQTNASVTQTKMNELAAGTSSLYVRADGSNVTAPLSANNQRISGVALPTSGTDAANKNYSDGNLGGRMIDSAVPTNGQVLVWNNSTSRWVASTVQDSTVLAHARATNPSCSAGQASQWNGSTWSCVALGGGAGGATSYNTATGQISLNAVGNKINDFKFTEGGMIQLPDATAMGLGGSHFTLINSGTDALPIVDASGQFLTGLSSSSSTEVYLFNNGSSAGDWRFSNASAATGVAHRVIETSFGNPLQSSYFDFITGSKYLAVYSLGSPDNKVVARVVDVNVANHSVTAWGAITDVNTSSSSIDWVRVVSPTKALIRSSGNVYLVTLNTGSNTVSFDSSATSSCSGYSGRPLGGHFYCWYSSTLYKYEISGSSVTESSIAVSFDIKTFEGLDSTHGIAVGRYYNSGVYDVKARAIDLGTMTLLGSDFTVVSATSGTGSSDEGTWGRLSYPASSSAVLAIVKINDQINRMYKLSVDGSYNVTGTTGPDIPSYMSSNPRFETLSSNTYVVYSPTMSGSVSERKQITNLLSMTLSGSAVKASDCWGHRYAIGKCLDLSQVSSKPSARFDIGH